jgi:hypothetical protein
VVAHCQFPRGLVSIGMLGGCNGWRRICQAAYQADHNHKSANQRIDEMQPLRMFRSCSVSEVRRVCYHPTERFTCSGSATAPVATRYPPRSSFYESRTDETVWSYCNLIDGTCSCRSTVLVQREELLSWTTWCISTAERTTVVRKFTTLI